MSNLEQYYPGDARWEAFASMFEGEGKKCEAQSELFERVDEPTANVICAAFGTHALEWLRKPVPALDGKTPEECLQTPEGRRRLRTMLMRMPW